MLKCEAHKVVTMLGLPVLSLFHKYMLICSC